MKTIKNILVLILPLCLIYLVGCRSSSNPSEEELQIEKLAKTWTAGTVTLNNNNVSSWFEGMELTLVTDQSFSTNIPNSPSPWTSRGTWDFTTNADGTLNLQTIQRNDGLVMNISELTAEALVVTFTHANNEHSSGRNLSVGGSYVFEFIVKH